MCIKPLAINFSPLLLHTTAKGMEEGGRLQDELCPWEVVAQQPPQPSMCPSSSSSAHSLTHSLNFFFFF